MRTYSTGSQLDSGIAHVFIDLGSEGKVDAVTGLYAEGISGMREENPVKPNPVKLDTEFQVLLLRTDPVGREKNCVGNAQNRLRVCTAEGL